MAKGPAQPRRLLSWPLWALLAAMLLWYLLGWSWPRALVHADAWHLANNLALGALVLAGYLVFTPARADVFLAIAIVTTPLLEWMVALPIDTLGSSDILLACAAGLGALILWRREISEIALALFLSLLLIALRPYPLLFVPVAIGIVFLARKTGLRASLVAGFLAISIGISFAPNADAHRVSNLFSHLIGFVWGWLIATIIARTGTGAGRAARP